MLTPEYYDAIRDKLDVLYDQFDETVIRDIVRRLVKNGGTLTDTAKHQLEREIQAGLLYDDILEEIVMLEPVQQAEIKDIFINAINETIQFDRLIYEAAGIVTDQLKHLSAQSLQVVQADLTKTSGEVCNLTKTTALTSQRMFIKACSLAEMQIESGAFDYNTAIRNAVTDAIESGPSTITYKSGATRRIDTAVRTAVMTGVGQTSAEVCMQNAKLLGVNRMRISAHYGARTGDDGNNFTNHAWWQGKTVSLIKEKGFLTVYDIGYGTGKGFAGYNCRHDWYPDVGIEVYSPEQLEEYANKTVTYNGKAIPYYDATQRQRAMERSIKETKRQLVGLDEAIKVADNPDLREQLRNDFQNKSVKLKADEKKYKNYCYQTKLKTQSQRLQTGFFKDNDDSTVSFNRSVARKAVHANKQAKTHK